MLACREARLQSLERLSEATTRTEALSAKLAEKTAAQTEARARLSERLRDLRIEATPGILGNRK